jgi:hypothetical protein
MNYLERQTLQIIGENTDSPDVFTDNEEGLALIRDAINDAIQELNMLTGTHKRDYLLPLFANKPFYRLEFKRDFFGWVTDAWIQTYRRRLEQTDIFRLNKYNPRWMQNVGTPQSYYPIGNNWIGIWPTPGGSNLAIEIQAVIIPEQYDTEHDRIKIKEAWTCVCTNYAASEYYASIRDFKTAQYFLGLYSEAISDVAGIQIAADKRWNLRTGKEPWPKPTG